MKVLSNGHGVANTEIIGQRRKRRKKAAMFALDLADDYERANHDPPSMIFF